MPRPRVRYILNASPEKVAEYAALRERVEETRSEHSELRIEYEGDSWEPQEHQLMPSGRWWMWVFRGGRGTGKTDTGAFYTNRHMEGPACDPRAPGGHHGLIVGPTHGDAVAACVDGVSGLRAHNPAIQKINRKEGTFVVWPNGAEAVILGAHTENDAERLRAHGNVCFWWFDEAAIARYLSVAIDNVAFGGRLGPRPHGIATSTPKPTRAFRGLLKMPNVVETHASSYDNAHLPEAYQTVLQRYEGTRLGRQEIYADLLDDYEGALWNRDMIDAHRTRETYDSPEATIEALGISRIVVGIDPSTWDPDLGDDPGTIGEGLETGIVVVGIGGSDDAPEVFILEDASLRSPAEEWAQVAVDAYHRWGANSLVPEVNLGGMVLSTIRLVDSTVAVYRSGNRAGVRAAMGKRARAEPVAVLYEKGRAHHVGRFSALEDQMCGWDPREPWSPDRIDALVWAVTVLAPELPRGAVSTADQLTSASLPLG